MKITRKYKDGTVKEFDAKDRGLCCPSCGCRHLRVVYTRDIEGDQRERRKECRNCGKRITTHEAMSF